MKLLIEYLKPRYSEIAKHLTSQGNEDTNKAWHALNTMTRMIINAYPCNDILDTAQKIIETENDMLYVQGKLNSKEETILLKHKKELIEQQQKELQQYIQSNNRQ